MLYTSRVRLALQTPLDWGFPVHPLTPCSRITTSQGPQAGRGHFQPVGVRRAAPSVAWRR
jgi:hypothetical protein